MDVCASVCVVFWCVCVVFVGVVMLQFAFVWWREGVFCCIIYTRCICASFVIWFDEQSLVTSIVLLVCQCLCVFDVCVCVFVSICVCSAFAWILVLDVSF